MLLVLAILSFVNYVISATQPLMRDLLRVGLQHFGEGISTKLSVSL